jgi:TonB family protein
VVAASRADLRLVAGLALKTFLVLVALAGPAVAQPAPEHVLVPPAPLEMPAIPPPAVPYSAPVEVEVLLTIDGEGAVSAVEVTRSGGPEFDAAVEEGVRRFRFAPATQDGNPITVRLPFKQRFEPPPPPLVDRRPELDALLEGVVITRGTRAPIAAATVAALDPESRDEWVTVTDGRGLFSLPVRSGRALEIRVVAADHERFVQSERLTHAQRLRVRYLVDRRSYGQYQSYVRADTDRTEVSRTTLSGRELTHVPGTFGDPFRVVNLLPGVASVMSLLPLPVVRGSSPGNTGILLDGVRLPLLFHLLAGPSVIHPELVDRVDFYPGGFPVRYGGYTGGIVDGVTRVPRPDERRVDLDLNLTQAGGLVREPLGRGVTATVAGRIGYPGVVLGLLTRDASLSYWDYQARLDGGNERHHWTAFLYGASDDLKGRSSSSEPLRTIARLAFHRADLRYQHQRATGSELFRVVLGYDDSEVGSDAPGEVSGMGTLGNGTWSVMPQAKLQQTAASWLDMGLGVESLLRTVKNPASTLPPSTRTGMDLSMIFNQDGLFTQSGAYAEAVIKPGQALRLIPGLRADLYDEHHPGADVSQVGIDPRLLARYRLSAALTLKGVIGRYHQPPRLFVPLPGVDESSLRLGLLASTQYSVGAEARLGPRAEADVNVYYNDMNPVLFDLAVNPGAGDVQQPVPATPPWQLPPPSPTGENNRTLDALFNRRRGRSYGLELLLRRRDPEHLFGWISYTLSWSQRLQPEGWHFFDFDRRHILNVVGGVRLPRNWELGTRFLFQTGTPLTTIFGRNISRTDPQFRFDLRIDKRAVWNNWLLDFYVDIINATVAEESGGTVGGDSIRYLLPTVGFRAVF